MAKKNAAPICSRCETPYRRATSFCTACGSPTPWATHEDRVKWEVGQWRASRDRAEESAGQMMLVKTDGGYQPVPYQHHYVWDQPLHPEREQPEPTSPPRARYVSPPVAATATAVAPGPAAPAPAPASAPPAPPEPALATANGLSEAGPSEVPEAPAPVVHATNGSAHPQRALPSMYIPAPEVVRRPARTEQSAPTPPPAPEAKPTGEVRVSRKAVVLGLALALGLPLGGRVMNALRSEPAGVPAPSREGSVPSQLRAVPVGTLGSGFVQVGPDTARYAVLVKNLNAVFTARSVAVHVSLLDANGGVVGTSVEWVSSVPPNATLGFAGATGVAGPVARVTARVETGSFDRAAETPSYDVRGVRVTRSATEVVVQASVSAGAAGRARVVAVHLDEAGRVVGGDFSFVDLPKAPRAASVVISTADSTQRVFRAEVFVLPPG